MPIKDTREEIASKIADEMVGQGRIPEGFKDEFVKTLVRELGREVRRLGSETAEVTARALFARRLLKLAA